MAVRSCLQVFDVAREEAQVETFGFSAHYTAARLAALREASGNLQEWDWFREQCSRYGFKATDVFSGNPPSAALVMLPIATLPHPQARVVWTWLTMAFWFAGVTLLAVGLLRGIGFPGIIASIAALLSLAALYEPLQANLHFGQVYVFLFLLQSLCCVLWLRGFGDAAGLSCGAMLAFKGYGLPLLTLAFLRRDWRFVGWSLAGFGVLAGFSGFLMGWGHWADFIETHLSDTRFSGIGTPALQTLKSFLIVGLNIPATAAGPATTVDSSANWGLFALSALIQLGLLLWLSEFRLFPGPSDSSPNPRSSQVSAPSPSALSACIAIGLIFSPRAENHVYPLAMTGLLLMLPELRRLSVPSAGTILAGVLLSWPFHFQDRTVLSGWHLLTDYPRLWGAIVLLFSALFAEWNRRRGIAPRSETWAGAHAACLVGVALVLLYVRPWRDPIYGPLMALSRTDGNRVTLLRLDWEEREVATVPVSCDGPFGLAFEPDRRWLYAACTDNSQISLIDIRDRREFDKFAAPRLPAWAQWRPGTREMWISNEGAGKVSIYRAGGSEILAEIPTGLGPCDIVFDREGRLAWVSNETSGNVSFIDATTYRKLLDVPVGQVPQGMKLTPDARWLLVANFRSNSLSVLDAKQTREVAQIPIGRGPVDVALSSEGGNLFAYVVCFTEGVVSVVDVDRRAEIERIPVGANPFGIAAHPAGNRVYVCVGGSNRLVVLEGGSRGRILRRMPFDGNPLQIAIAP